MLLALLSVACGRAPVEPQDAQRVEFGDPMQMPQQPAPAERPRVSGLDILVRPAPGGDPKSVALAAITMAGQPCESVSAADRVPSDGSISATCSAGERYRVFDLEGHGPIAMNCAAAEKLGVSGC